MLIFDDFIAFDSQIIKKIDKKHRYEETAAEVKDGVINGDSVRTNIKTEHIYQKN